MTATSSTPTSYEERLEARPKRADARRNYDRVVAAARLAFAEHGRSASLEEVARGAEVGIGTLYRHFPNRQALLEAVYVGELEDLRQASEELADLPPWEALDAWVHRFVGYMVTKQALANELLEYFEKGSEFFTTCRRSLVNAGEPLLIRAQLAGEVRGDIDFNDLIQLVGGITKMAPSDQEQVNRVLGVALDGLRVRA
jgi:AcrR family transcriptional regulator